MGFYIILSNHFIKILGFYSIYIYIIYIIVLKLMEEKLFEGSE